MTVWALLCWGIRVKWSALCKAETRGVQAYGSNTKKVGEAGGRLIINDSLEHKEPFVVVCLPGAVWRTTTLRHLEQERLAPRCEHDIQQIAEKLQLGSDDILEGPGFFLLLESKIKFTETRFE
jgi:hypothetical protein